MKTATIAMVLVALVLGGCANQQKVVATSRLIIKDNLWYEVDSDQPFTGKAVEYWDNGQKKREEEWLDGHGHGQWTRWNENGQKLWEQEYRNGGWHGKEFSWYRNGNRLEFGEWRDSMPHGKFTRWYQNGQKYNEAEYDNGKLVSSICWDENGTPTDCPEMFLQDFTEAKIYAETSLMP